MANRSLLNPPTSDQRARFAHGFGQRVLLTIDTEEEFDWNAPFQREGFGLEHLSALPRFQSFCEERGVVPVYLIDWPIATSTEAQDILGDAVRAGRAEVGIQLHPWVNPPHDEEVSTANSFAGSLPEPLEREKLTRLRDAIAENFGVTPQIYRAGRYGLGPNTAGLLKELGVAIDSSVRANYDYSAGHGPDYSRHPLNPYWTDADQTLLELPLTTVYWGMLRQLGKTLFPLSAKVPKVGGVLSRAGLLERISLTPEGVTKAEALRGIDIAIDDELPVLILSFHSPSLAPGYTPYVSDAADVEALYDWLGSVLAYLGKRGVRPTSVREITQSVIV
ncbi:polysaccharide deacetylase family protein [Qipengyuania marisflavi]|uniref:WalW protein n=1 Tax=Qipengyuania marisflavi TaxID=2486356 RepID=A0A5S3P777_9SPHN|nr:polysaccharide deacetylase family protein [Qipengyuania marisflavi]TMM49007.1 WalW protein [Qipengyuania marisflavi]